jgi:pimeloyl-ACP methyl ester carboxylesterase
MLLHGFPEHWRAWRGYIGPLAEAGFHVVAPDQRGYNLSDKPEGISNYRLDQLAGDIAGLASTLGRDTFNVAGHDWGASVAWWLAEKYPNRVNRMAALNAPHPAVWVHAMRDNPAQRKKSSYVRILRLPRLPEFLLRLRNYDALVKSLKQAARPGAVTESDLALYREAWGQPQALTSMINWYRALLQQPPELPAGRPISCPTLVMWGKRDVYAEPVLAEESTRLCTSARIEYLEEATHWSPQDEPDRVGQLLGDFFSK